MSPTDNRAKKIARATWTVLTGFIAESFIFAAAVLPAALFWEWHFHWRYPSDGVRIWSAART